MGHYNFTKDLQASQASVDLVKKWLKGNNCKSIIDINTKYYDIQYVIGYITETIEVKEDFQYDLTGNVAIEIKSRGKSSGICTSTADYWIYVLDGKMYRARRSAVLCWLIQHWDRYRRVEAGDEGTSIVALVKMVDFYEIFTEIKFGEMKKI